MEQLLLVRSHTQYDDSILFSHTQILVRAEEFRMFNQSLQAPERKGKWPTDDSGLDPQLRLRFSRAQPYLWQISGIISKHAK